MRPPALWEDTNTRDNVLRMLVASFGLHVVVIGVSAILSALSLHAPLPPPPYEVSLVAPIIKGKPGHGSAAAAVRPPPGTADTPPPKPAATLPPVKSTAKDEMTVPSTAKGADAVKEALERAKRQARLEKLAQEEAARRAKTTDTPDPNATPVAANPQPGKAGTGSGEGTGNGGVDYGTWDGLPGSATYEQQIQAIVTQNWTPFTGNLDPKNPLQCMIRVVIGFDGTILTKTMEQSSKNASFDASAMAALIKVGKFPPPPLELKGYLAHKGIPLRFDSRTKLAAR